MKKKKCRGERRGEDDKEVGERRDKHQASMACTIQYNTIQYCTILYCTVLYCTVLYRTVLCIEA